MENNIEVRTKSGPSGIGCLTAEAAASSTNGDAFNAAFACHSSANPFKDQLGDDSEDLFQNLVKQFGDELNSHRQPERRLRSWDQTKIGPLFSRDRHQSR